MEKDPEASDEIDPVPIIKLQFQGQLDQRTKESLLMPFNSVVFGMLKVKILNHGGILEAYARKLKQKMGPRTIWTKAMAWHVLETLRGMKHHADGLLCNGDMVAAAKHYRNVSLVYDMCPIFHFEDGVYSSDIAQPFVILASLMITAAIMETLTAIRLANIERVSAARRITLIDDLAKRVQRLPESDQSAAPIPYAVAMWHLYICRFLLHRTEQNVNIVLAGMRSVARDLIRDGSGAQIQHYITTDLKLIEQCACDAEVRKCLSIRKKCGANGRKKQARMDYLGSDPSTLRLHCRASGAGHLDVVIFTSAAHDTPKPAYLEGYVDKAHYEQIRANNPEIAAKLS